MAFIPNTEYFINGVKYNTFYLAINKARIMGNGTVVKDSAKKEVFTVNGDTNTFYLYRYNEPREKVEGQAEMRAWLNQNNYSQAIDGTGALSNSSISGFINFDNYVSLNDVYNKQETAAGGYYYVRSFSSMHTRKAYRAARVSIDLKNIKTNLKNTNAYVILGAQNTERTVEIGLQLALIGNNYVWQAFRLPNPNGELDWIGEVGSINCGTTVTLEMLVTGGTAKARVDYKGGNIPVHEVPFDNGKPHGFYRMISFVPKDAQDTPTPNLNNGEYFSGAAFKNCQIMQENDISYKSWGCKDLTLNEFAVAFNDQFIDVSDTERVSISYQGRDSNNKLIIS